MNDWFVLRMCAMTSKHLIVRRYTTQEDAIAYAADFNEVNISPRYNVESCGRYFAVQEKELPFFEVS